jgi:release factor glutamine methyltransferase
MSDHLVRQAQKISEHRSRNDPFEKELSGMQLTVLPKVFPGGTDTALLCDSIRIAPGERVLDLCTGTGAVAIKAALAGAGEVIGTDISPDAIRNANLNKTKLGLSRLHLFQASVYPAGQDQFDVITMNPPYTDNPAPDTAAAMFWDEGNSVVKAFFSELSAYLKPAGRAYLSWPSFAPESLIRDLAVANACTLEVVGRRSSGSSGFEYAVYCICLR